MPVPTMPIVGDVDYLLHCFHGVNVGPELARTLGLRERNRIVGCVTAWQCEPKEHLEG
jgi:hypothetical protein